MSWDGPDGSEWLPAAIVCAVVVSVAITGVVWIVVHLRGA